MNEPTRILGRVSLKRAILTFLACGGVIVLTLALVPIRLLPSSTGTNVQVHPGENVEEVVESHPPGTSFTISPGVYRLVSILPKNGDSFLGEAGAVFTGAKVLSSFNQSGQYWVANVNVEARGFYRGKCDPEHPACTFPEDVFVDGVPLQRVTEQSSVSPGKWYLDYSTRRAYIGTNPNHHKVEISLVAHAFYGGAKNVTIQGLTIEKYADTAGEGAIQGESKGGQRSHGWIVRNNVIKFNHGMGIRVSDGMQVLNNKIDNNGQMGLGGSGNSILVAGNEIAYNNYAGYKYGWEAGGAKFTFTKGLVVRDNFAHNNNGPGLWTDLQNRDVLYDHNRTTANRVAGILHEVSYRAVIRDNTIEEDGFNGTGQRSPWHGAGIVITGSSNVEVYGNTVTDCMNGIVGLQPNRKDKSGALYALRNLDVHNNVITQDTGIAAGILTSIPGNAVFESWGNRFVNNTFNLASHRGKYFYWLNSPETLAAWHAKHQ